MPELPDIELYLACLRPRVLGSSFSGMKTLTPFILKTVSPRPSDFVGAKVTDLWRIGKRIAWEFDNGACLVIHLMVSGRLRWLGPDAKPPAKISHCSWSFPDGTLVLTEASSKKRAGIWLLPSRAEALALDPGGVDPLVGSDAEIISALRAENRTLKRALSNPHRIAGIGGAYSDEILHRARLSPLRLTSSLSDEEASRLVLAAKETLTEWRNRLMAEYSGGQKFPGAGEVTAFRPDFAVHGRYGLPCPVCGKPVQRIVYADNETNYCAECQNGGVILADRSLSRLLKDDWPRSFGEE